MRFLRNYNFLLIMNFILPMLALSILYTHYVIKPEYFNKDKGESNGQNLIQAQVLGVQDLPDVLPEKTLVSINEPLKCLEISSGYGFSVTEYNPGLDSDGEDLPVEKKQIINALYTPLVSKEERVYLGINGSITLQFAKRFTNVPKQADIFINKVSYEDVGSCYLHEPRAKVSISQDNINWVEVGITCTKGQFEFPKSISWARYLRVTDNTVVDALNKKTWGFSLHGVKAMLCLP